LLVFSSFCSGIPAAEKKEFLHAKFSSGDGGCPCGMCGMCAHCTLVTHAHEATKQQHNRQNQYAQCGILNLNPDPVFTKLQPGFCFWFVAFAWLFLAFNSAAGCCEQPGWCWYLYLRDWRRFLVCGCRFSTAIFKTVVCTVHPAVMSLSDI
jgi:hypothetical protein